MYIEFPKHLHKAGGAFCVVQAEREQELAIADGWQLQPVLEADEQAEADSDTPAGEKKKRGRKPRAKPADAVDESGDQAEDDSSSE